MNSRQARSYPRVFLGLQEIAGYYTRVLEGLLDLGVTATFVDLSDHPFQYGKDEPVPLARAIKHAMRARHARPQRDARTLCLLVWESLLRMLLLIWAAFKFDFFIFGFGSTFLKHPALDLRLLKLLRKRVVFVFHGSDERPAYLNGSIVADAGNASAKYLIELARATEQRLIGIDRYADAVVDNALSAHFHKRPCVHWIVMGVPSAPPPVHALSNADTSHCSVRILHSPSQPHSKGTNRIRQAIENVRAKGHDVEFIEISGRPHAEVVMELMQCDFVIDQLYSDTPMATFAAEAARFGKPAVVGGYGMAAFQRMLPADAIPPVLYCHPDDIETAVERLITDSAFRAELGQSAQRFVTTRWARHEIAARLLRVLQGNYPRSWMFDPKEIRYCHGYGMTEDHARARVASVIAEGGVGALRLKDKPELEQCLRHFAARHQCPQRMPSCSSNF